MHSTPSGAAVAQHQRAHNSAPKVALYMRHTYSYTCTHVCVGLCARVLVALWSVGWFRRRMRNNRLRKVIGTAIKLQTKM